MAEDVGGIQTTVAGEDSGLDQKLARLRSSIRLLEAEMQVLRRQMQQGTVDTRAMADSLDMLRSANARFTDLAATMTAATRQVDTGLDGVGKASTTAAKEMIAVGQYAADMQSAFGAFVNQVPQVAAALGAGAGLSGGLTVATVAANRLVMSWDDLTDTFRESKSITAVERMDQLGTATSRTAGEAARLGNLMRAQPQAPTLRGVTDAEVSNALATGAGRGELDEKSRADGVQEAFVDPIVGSGEDHRNTAPLASLQYRLAHLSQDELSAGGTFGGPDYEQSTKAVAGDDPQLRKLQDIGKTLEEIRKLYAGTKTIGVKRRR